MKAAPAKKAVKKVTPPSRTKNARGLTLENYVDDHIVLEGNDVSFRTAINLFACKNTTVEIKGKAKMVLMESCKNCTFIID